MQALFRLNQRSTRRVETSDPASKKYLAEQSSRRRRYCERGRDSLNSHVIYMLPAAHGASGFCAQIPANVMIPVIERGGGPGKPLNTMKPGLRRAEAGWPRNYFKQKSTG